MAGITYLGQRDYSLRAWLDPDKLAALEPRAPWTWSRPSPSRTSRSPPGRSASSPSRTGQQFQLTINTLGRLTDPEQFADIILKAAPGQPASQPTPAPPATGRRRPAGRPAEADRHDGPQATGIVRLRDVVTR